MERSRYLTLLSMCSLVALLALPGCSSADIDEQGGEPVVPPGKDDPAYYHDKIRENPYPKQNNELYINPSPLVVPTKMKGADYLQFSLSRNSDFSGDATITSKEVPWNMFNVHRKLESGRWHWRFRSVDKAGTSGPWSDVYTFEVEANAPVFVTPEFEAFIDNIPRRHPRLYCFLDDGIEAARKNVAHHDEYAALLSRAQLGLNADYSTVDPYDHAEELKNQMFYLYTAYYLTLDRKYLDKMIVHLRRMITVSVPDDKLFASNFGSTDIARVFIQGYDMAYDVLSAAEKNACEELMIRVARYYYKMYCGNQENNIFDNHFWQHNLRVLMKCAYMLFDKSQYAAEARQMLEYYYELWTARAPDSGYNRSGVWQNGPGYFEANLKTLFYIPSLFSYVTGVNFLEHPWYRSVGMAMVYTWPPGSRSAGFGDNSEKSDSPLRATAAFADFIARECQDPYAGWYASQCKKLLAGDYEFRIHRMVRTGAYGASSLPPGYPKYVWYEDAGEVVVHSDMADMSKNMTVSFRSSPFGSGSHTLADQNAFNMLYRGVDVYMSSGYYLNFSDAHNIMSYRHTRAHNSILIDGIGQPFSTKGCGDVQLAMGGNHITYCVGDASNAYGGISDDPMWITNFANASITQTPDNGFGRTPLTRYKRHILVLHPDKVVIYDELEASEPVRWDWLLHSPVRFQIDQGRRCLKTLNMTKDFSSSAQLFSNRHCTITQTDRFAVPPAVGVADNGKYPNQWHLTASFAPCASNRILTIVQIVPGGATASEIVGTGDEYICGDWRIKAELDTNKSPELQVCNSSTNALFSLGSENPAINNQIFIRTPGAVLLYDYIDGSWQVSEQFAHYPISSRIKR